MWEAHAALQREYPKADWGAPALVFRFVEKPRFDRPAESVTLGPDDHERDLLEPARGLLKRALPILERYYAANPTASGTEADELADEIKAFLKGRRT